MTNGSTTDDTPAAGNGDATAGPSRDPERVRRMFSGIAGRYDVVNRVLSGGIDTRWRRRVLRRAGGDLRGRTGLDVACGTGDLAALFQRNGARMIGVDFTYEMVARAPRKDGDVTWLQGDALALPVATDSVDVTTIAFGLRNVADRRRALDEFLRVTKPGGRVLVLEFGMPDRDLFGRAYRSYLTHLLPRIGGALTGDRSAYGYLDETVQAWPDHEALRLEMEDAGFVDCACDRLMRGIACLHVGDVPRAGGESHGA